jgi:hypothetical protein
MIWFQSYDRHYARTKTADQPDLQAMHRVRERLVSQLTGISNQIRAFLLLTFRVVKHCGCNRRSQKSADAVCAGGLVTA